MIRFGAFDFNPATGELRREGAPVRLQPQPAQVLGLLLAKPGQVVTREELRQALWGADTFVDFDRGLNFCVAQIRSALRDSAESPLYVKTVPKRGYQFIAPIAALPVAAAPALPKKLNLRALLGAIAALLLVVLYFVLRAAEPSRLAVARFDNATDNPSIDALANALNSAVVGELTSRGGKRYAVIGNAAILREPRERRNLLAIHASLKAELVLLGEIQPDATGLQVFAQLIRLPDQTHLKVTRFHIQSSPSVTAQRIVHDLFPLTHPSIP